MGVGDDLSKLAEDKMRVVLNLLRTNSTGDDVLKITQGYRNLVEAEDVRNRDSKSTRKQGTGA